MIDISAKRITIVGLQNSGSALIGLVRSLGGLPCATELKSFEALSMDIQLLIKKQNIEIETGGHTKSFVQKSDYLIISPGVRSDAEIIQWAREKNIPVLGEIEFALQFNDKPVIAVTGSNGKTTVSTLIHQLIIASGKSSCLCGNIGNPISAHVLDSSYDFFVVEVSSFQLENIHNETNPYRIKAFHPFISVFLNFSVNHLDRHKDLEEYFHAKMNIFRNQNAQDFAVVNGKNTYIYNEMESIKSQVVDYTLEESFDNPNFRAVSCVGKILGIDAQRISDVLLNFKGVEHRMERLDSINSVNVINDAKSTTAEATVWALSRINEPVILICGGRDKQIDFSVVKKIIEERVKTVVLIGETKEKLAELFDGLAQILKVDTLSDAIQAAFDAAEQKDCILFSPMCASFDMFQNYIHRGESFKKLIAEYRKRTKSYA